MDVGRSILYIIWALGPILYFGLALWCLLERYSKSPTKQNPEDYFKQGIFLTIAVLVAVWVDQKLLATIVEQYSPSFIPLGFYQVMLLPVLLLIGAKVFGGSEEIRIQHPAGLSKKEGKKRKRRRR